MDALAQLALMTKAKLVFETPDTFLSFPALSPLSYLPDELDFTKVTTTQQMLKWSEFCRLTNALPQGDLYQQSDSFFWDAYHQVLQTAQVAQGAMTQDQNTALQQALAFLYVQGPDGLRTDSAAVVAYKQYRDAWFQATENYKNAQITADSSSDPNVKQQWQSVDEPRLRALVQTADDDWNTKGFKAQVDQARQVEESAAASSPSVTWGAWKSQFDPNLDVQTDPNNEPFGLTGFSPSDVLAHADWPTFNLAGSEIAQLVSSAPAELKGILDPQGSASTVTSLSFEFCSVAVNRPWFHSELFAARFWRLADPSQQLSDGLLPPHGQWPAYITAMVFARNIVVTSSTETGSTQTTPLRTFIPLALHRDMVMREAVTTSSPMRVMARTSASFSRAATEARTVQPEMIPAARSVTIPSNAVARLNAVTFTRLPIIPVEPGPTPTPPPGNTQPPSPDVSILAFICKRLPKCPDPDPSLNWGP
ncbi:MAG TPA: hypothetical protein VF898_08625 [Chloroflexota bacterium]